MPILSCGSSRCDLLYFLKFLMNQPIEKFRHFTKGKGNSSRTRLEGASIGALFGLEEFSKEYGS
jgi:hypothetical protein